MTDEKILELSTGKPFTLVTGQEGTSPQPVTGMIERILRYAREKKYMAVGIAMVDADNKSITAFHMEEGMSTALAGATQYLAFRINKKMDEE